jgi:hypothetical protein
LLQASQVLNPYSTWVLLLLLMVLCKIA